jgi:N-acetyl sugar amidotransferase
MNNESNTGTGKFKSLRYCSKCLIPETHETIVFDEEGVCNVCRQIEFKHTKIDWESKGEALDELIEQYRGKSDYDCVVPFSGGKDSTWTLYYLVKIKKLKCLVVQFNHGFMRPTLLENNTRTFRALGCDVITFTTNWKIVQKLMLESLKRKGDFCWHCHTGIFSYPMHVAVKYNVPLIFWGEPQAEYTSYYTYEDTLNEAEEVDETRFNRFVNLGITADDMAGMIDVEDKRDLIPYSYPKLKDLMKIGYRSVCLGSYVPWDVKKQVGIIQEELGWKGDKVEGVPAEYNYEKIECGMQGIRDYLKFIKRGYSRVSHLTSIDIRNGRLSREEGEKLVDEFEGKKPASLPVFLDYVGIDEEEFYKFALQHQVDPFNLDQDDINALGDGEEVWDQKLWYKEPACKDCNGNGCSS